MTKHCVVSSQDEDHHCNVKTGSLHHGNGKANQRKKEGKENIDLFFCADGSAERRAGSVADPIAQTV
jgi:hypothetical protein